MNRRFDQFEPGLRDAHRQRRAPGFSLPFFQFLERAFDLFAPRLLRGPCRPRHRLRTRDACHAPFRLPLAGKDRIKKDPRDSADRDRHQEEKPVSLHGNFAF